MNSISSALKTYSSYMGDMKKERFQFDKVHCPLFKSLGGNELRMMGVSQGIAFNFLV